MGTLAENAAAVKAAQVAIDAAIVEKGGTTSGGLANAAAAIASIPSGGGGIPRAAQIKADAYGTGSAATLIRADGSEFATPVLYSAGSHGFCQFPNDIVAVRCDSNDTVSDNHYVKVNGRRLATGERHDIQDGDDIYIFANSCLLRGTLVTLADGTQKPIEDVTYDDELLTWDFDRGMLSSAKPCWIKREQTANYLFRNVLSDGTVLLTTGKSATGWGHRMFDETRQSFVYTTQSVGDTIRTLGGLKTHVSCTRFEGLCDYYNVITAHDFNLFANGVLTSCSLNNGMYDIRAAKYVKDGVAPLRHSRDEFAGIPDALVDGLRLCEQRGTADELNAYARRLIVNMKERI